MGTDGANLKIHHLGLALSQEECGSCVIVFLLNFQFRSTNRELTSVSAYRVKLVK